MVLRTPLGRVATVNSWSNVISKFERSFVKESGIVCIASRIGSRPTSASPAIGMLNAPPLVLPIANIMSIAPQHPILVGVMQNVGGQGTESRFAAGGDYQLRSGRL